MKVVICGAGQVGTSIAAYLSEEGNSVTIVDSNPENIAKVNDNLDINGIVGYASHPATLEKAGAADAELILAATHFDEVNMVACQVAHSLFNIPTKIARIRDQHYLDPMWAPLFSRDHLPIDVMISPEIEVAKSIANRLRVPGAYNVIPLADGLVQLVSVLCRATCPLINTPLKHLTNIFPNLSVIVVAIIRGEAKIIPTSEDEIYPGDEVYFVTATEHMQRAISAFGYDEKEARRILIVGGGRIGTRLAEDILASAPSATVKIIESDPARARFIAEKVPGATILNGDAMSRELLEEANIANTEAVISVTNHDESNILVSLLAKQNGGERTIALVNNTVFAPMVAKMGIDALVNPRTITVSTILQHIRRGRIKSAHSLRDGFAEVLEMEALDTSAIVNTPIREIQRPDRIIFGLIVRDGKIIVPRPDTVIKPEDRVIILAAHDQVKKVEQMFAVRPEYF